VLGSLYPVVTVLLAQLLLAHLLRGGRLTRTRQTGVVVAPAGVAAVTGASVLLSLSRPYDSDALQYAVERPARVLVVGVLLENGDVLRRADVAERNERVAA